MPDDDPPESGTGVEPPPGETESPAPESTDPPTPETPSPTCCPTCKCKTTPPRKPRQPRKPRVPTITPTVPPLPASLEDIIREAIAGPKSATVDGQNVAAHDLRQLIDADRYLAAKKAAGKPAIRFTKLVSPGAG